MKRNKPLRVHARARDAGDSKLGRITEPEARAAYLAMGPNRSLEKLHRAQAGASPSISLRTLKTWSSKFEWVRLAVEFDSRVGAQVVARVEAQQVRDGANRLRRMQGFVDAAFERAEQLLATAEDIGDLKEIVAAAIGTEEKIQVMLGGVSDRTQNLAGAETPEARAQRQRREIEAEFEIDVTNGNDQGRRDH